MTSRPNTLAMTAIKLAFKNDFHDFTVMKSIGHLAMTTSLYQLENIHIAWTKSCENFYRKLNSWLLKVEQLNILINAYKTDATFCYEVGVLLIKLNFRWTDKKKKIKRHDQRDRAVRQRARNFWHKTWGLYHSFSSFKVLLSQNHLFI